VDTFRRRYELALEWLVIFLMAAMAIEVTAGVLFRTFGASLVWYDEVASILLAWLTFYGSALASAKRASRSSRVSHPWRSRLPDLGSAGTTRESSRRTDVTSTPPFEQPTVPRSWPCSPTT